MSAVKNLRDYIDKNKPDYGDTELLYLSFRLLIEDKNEAIDSLKFNTDMKKKTGGYERVRVKGGIGKHKVTLDKNSINKEKELDGRENGILYCELEGNWKLPEKAYYYLLGSPWPFELDQVAIINTAIDHAAQVQARQDAIEQQLAGIDEEKQWGGKRRNSKRKSKKIKTHKRKTYKRKSKRSKRIKKSRRSFIKKTRTKKSRTNKSRANKSRANKYRKRMVGGSDDDERFKVALINLMKPVAEGGHGLSLGDVRRYWGVVRLNHRGEDIRGSEMINEVLDEYYKNKEETSAEGASETAREAGAAEAGAAEAALETIMDITKCTKEEAGNCLDAAGGDPEGAIGVFYGR